MRRPVLMAVLMAIALISVIYGKYRLDQSIKEGRFNTDTMPESKGEGGAKETPAAGGESQSESQLPKRVENGKEEGKVEGEGEGTAPQVDSHTEVMAALMQARESFRLRDKVAGEAEKDPHTTPNTILRSAEVLGALISMEQLHPESKAEFQAFYLECSKDTRVITVTRVQCLEKYIVSAKPSPEETKALIAATDPVVAKLYLEMQP